MSIKKRERAQCTEIEAKREACEMNRMSRAHIVRPADVLGMPGERRASVAAGVYEEEAMTKKRDLFGELTEGLDSLAERRAGKRTLRTHAVKTTDHAATGVEVSSRKSFPGCPTCNISVAVSAWSPLSRRATCGFPAGRKDNGCAVVPAIQSITLIPHVTFVLGLEGVEVAGGRGPA